jgi:hypothetical protein
MISARPGSGPGSGLAGDSDPGRAATPRVTVRFRRWMIIIGVHSVTSHSGRPPRPSRLRPGGYGVARRRNRAELASVTVTDEAAPAERRHPRGYGPAVTAWPGGETVPSLPVSP